MQIDNIQTYNNSNQNFKALRLKNGFEKYVKSMPKILNKLDDIEQDLSNTKNYHLDIGSDGFYITHTNGEKMYTPINIANAGKVLVIKARQGFSQAIKKLKYGTSQEVKQIEQNIKNAPTQIERTAEIVKVLDDYENLHK